MAAVSQGRRRTTYKWVLFLVCLTMFIPVAGWVGERVLDLAGRKAPAEGARPRPFTEAQMDAGFLLREQDAMVAAQLARTRKALRDAGYTDTLPPPEVSSTYVRSNGHRYGLVRTRIEKDEAAIQAVLVVGVVDGRIRRVVCIARDGNEVTLGSGPCAMKLAETFDTVL